MCILRIMSENPDDQSLQSLGGTGELHDLSELEPDLRQTVRWVIHSRPAAVAKLALSTPDDTTAIRLKGLTYAVTHILTNEQCTLLAQAIASEKPGKREETGVLSTIVNRASVSVLKDVRDALGWNKYPDGEDQTLDVIV